MDIHKSFLIFCDGACSGNPGPGGWGAVISSPEGEVMELGGREDQTTNNLMELTASTEALWALRNRDGPVAIYTDSVYVIRGITQWIWAWRKRNWKSAEGNDIANREAWESLLRAVMSRKDRGDIDWRWVRGHSGIPGNERVDEIAVLFSKRQNPKLFRGSLLQYGYALYDLPEEHQVPDREWSKDAKPKAKAHSYLSLVGGVPMRHMTWAECERRVKGTSGARFKKAMTPADESLILQEWGLRPDSIKD